MICHRASSDHKKRVAGAAAYLLLALLLHLSNAGGILDIAVLLHSLSRLLQLPAVVLQLLYVVLLLYDGALMLMLLSLQMAHILLEPLHLKGRCANQALQQSCWVHTGLQQHLVCGGDDSAVVSLATFAAAVNALRTAHAAASC